MTYSHLALSANAHDRLGLVRNDAEALALRWQDPESRVLVVAGTRVRPVDGALSWVPTSEAPEGLRLLLGERGGTTYWAVIADTSLVTDKAEWFPLRGLLPFLIEDLDAAPLVFHALGIAEWHWVTKYCPRCGGGLEPRSAGHELVCTACGRPQFPRTDPAVIMLITAGEPGTADERCLLAHNAGWPEGRFSTLAGFVEPGESLEDTVRREVREETGVVVGEVTSFGNQPWPLPSSLMLGFTGRATDETISCQDPEVEEARWLTREQMRAEAEAGTLLLPSGVSISRALVESWYGEPLPGTW